MKKENGISMVALFITIVVLIIIASVSINAISQDKIINETRQLSNDFENFASNEEKKFNDLKNKILTNF